MLSWKNKDFKHLDRKVLFKNLGTYLILGGVLFSMVFFGVCSPNFQNNMPTMLSGDAAKVAGESISQGDFRRAYTNTLERYRSQFRENFDPSMFQLSRVVLNQLIDERILYIEAKNLGLYAGEGDVVKVLQEAQIFKDESNKFSPERFQSFLRGNGYTEASLMHEIERSLMVQKLRELLLSMAYVSSEQVKLDKILTESKMNLSYLKFDPKNIKMVVSEQEVTEFLAKPENKEKVKKYFEDHKSEYEVAEKVKARHILIQFEGAFNAPEQAKKRKKDEALKLAKEILAKVRAKSAEFANLAKQYTDEAAGKSTGGDLGFFTRDVMDKVFSDAAFALKPGQISDVIETKFGFHIIKVEDKQAEKKQAFEQVEIALAKKMIEDEKKPTLLRDRSEKILAALKENKNIDAMLKEYGMQWQETGLVGLTGSAVGSLGDSGPIKDAALMLNAAQPLHPGVLDHEGSKIILKFKEFKSYTPNAEEFTPSKLREVADTQGFSQGYAFFSTLEKQTKDNLETKGRIWRNSEYVEFDSRLNRSTQVTEDNS